MEEQNPFHCRSHRLALKPPLPLEFTSMWRRRHHSIETNTSSTYGETTSYHIPELAQVVSKHLGSSTVVETESSQLPMVTIHPICETIPPEPNVVQLEVNPYPIGLYGETIIGQTRHHP